MNNILAAADIKRRGLAAIEQRLRHGPVHLVKRNKPAAVVLTEAEYQRLVGPQPSASPGMTVARASMRPGRIGPEDSVRRR